MFHKVPKALLCSHLAYLSVQSRQLIPCYPQQVVYEPGQQLDFIAARPPVCLRCPAIQQRHQPNCLPLPAQLLRHLERDQTAERPAAQQIRAFRLDRAQRRDVAGGHLLHTSERRLRAVEADGLKAVEGLLGPEAAH